MKIRMCASPRSPEQSEKRYWAVSVIRGFGILQVLGSAAASFFFLRPLLQMTFVSGNGMSYDASLLLATVLSILLGLFSGFILSAMTFAVAAAFDDLHTIRNYLRDITITGQYYDE